MRNVMKRRRRLPRGLLIAYAAILATSPDLFVGLEYAVIGSQQVLWQDAAGTATPVTAIGDPIGCVRHPLTGAIVASQSTLVSRPVWLGEGEGAFFDGVDDFLFLTYVNASTAHTMLCHLDGGSDTARIFDAQSGRILWGVAATAGVISLFDGVQRSSGQNWRSVPTVEAFAAGDGNVSFYREGVFVTSQAYTSRSVGGAVTLGQTHTGTGNGAWVGKIRSFVAYGTKKSASEMTALTEALS